MWQKCPVCNGSGKVENSVTTSVWSGCTVCKGTKIISVLNGLPPKEFVVNNAQAGDFKEFNIINQK